MPLTALRGGTARLWLVATCYGLWLACCAFMTFTGVGALWLVFMNSKRSLSADMGQSLYYAAFTAVVGTVGWVLLHRDGRQPGPGTYIVLAIAVVIAIHFAITSNAGGPPEGYWAASIIIFVVHFWFTIPIAAGATGQFVLCMRRFKAPD